MVDITQSPEEQQNPILRRAGVAAPPGPYISGTSPISPVKTSTTVSTTKTTTKKTAVEPVTPGPLMDVLDTIKAGVAEASANSKKVQEARTNQAKYQTVAADAAVASAKDAQIDANVKNLAIVEKEVTTQRLFNSGGGVEHLENLMTGLKQAQVKSLKEQRDVEELANEPGFMGAVKRALFLGTEVQQADVAEASKIKYQEAIRDFTGAASSVEKTLGQLKTTVTVASAAALSDKLAQDAAYKAAMNMSAAEEANALGATQALQDNKYQAAAAIDMYRLKMQAVSEAETSKIRNAQLTALERDEAGIRMISAMVRKGWERTGVPVADITDPTAMEEEHIKIQAMRKIPETAAKVAKAFSVGTGDVAPTSAETYRALAITNPKTLTDGSNKASTFLHEEASGAIAELNQAKAEGKLKGKLTNETLDAAINARSEAAWKQAENKILSSDLDNPNHAIPLSALIALPGLKDLPLTKVIKKTLDEADIKDMSPEKVLSIGLAQVRIKDNPEGKFTVEQLAEDINTIYTQAAHINTQTQNRLTLGYPPQVSYKAKLKDSEGFKITPYAFGGIKTDKVENVVNLMSTTEIKNYILKALVAKSIGVLDIGAEIFKGFVGLEKKPEDVLLPEDAVKIGVK